MIKYFCDICDDQQEEDSLSSVKVTGEHNLSGPPHKDILYPQICVKCRQEILNTIYQCKQRPKAAKDV